LQAEEETKELTEEDVNDRTIQIGDGPVLLRRHDFCPFKLGQAGCSASEDGK
jgi:hypothetical protein